MLQDLELNACMLTLFLAAEAAHLLECNLGSIRDCTYYNAVTGCQTVSAKFPHT